MQVIRQLKSNGLRKKATVDVLDPAPIDTSILALSWSPRRDVEDYAFVRFAKAGGRLPKWSLCRTHRCHKRPIPHAGCPNGQVLTFDGASSWLRYPARSPLRLQGMQGHLSSRRIIRVFVTNG